MDVFKDIRKALKKSDRSFVMKHSKRLQPGELVSVEDLHYGVGRADVLRLSALIGVAIVVVGGSVLLARAVIKKRSH